jgi:predicted MPP superfamily phosphohydrolase
MPIFVVVLAFLCLSQGYWFWRALAWARRGTADRRLRVALLGGLVIIYFLAAAYSFGWVGERHTAIRLTPGDALLGGPFAWWITCSLAGFLLVAIFRAAAAVFRLAGGMLWRRPAAPAPEFSPSRRILLARTAGVVAAAPFVGGAYGLLYGRLDLETPRQPIRLKRLPKAFDGFRIAQLSDIHVGPFMTEDQIRRYAAIANELKPHLIVLTGDYVTWDAKTEDSVVAALSGLKAPFGVFGCLGNHDAWAGVQDSITQLFSQAGIRILRAESVPVALHGEALNLMGIDFTSMRRMGPREEPLARSPLGGAEGLIVKDRVNILLSHNPDTFDHAAELRVDLSLAGHTHGGQAALEFISPQIAPSRLVTPYVAGLFQKPGAQLYVNRGIGTVGAPIRIGAPPEITLFELKRG